VVTVFPKQVQEQLAEVSQRNKTASQRFTCNIFGSQWDQFVETWAALAYGFVAEALGPYGKEPAVEIGIVSDGAHSAGANASYAPWSGQISLCPSYVDARPGRTLEKLTHELCHASLAKFPEGDPFYEEGFVDYSVWCLAHAPFWGDFREDMIKAAAYNIACRRDRALRDLSDYDRKRWAGGLFCSTMHGPWVISKLLMRKLEGNFTW
jgi:hypothetical protein